MNQATTKKEGALAINMFEADANQGAQNIAQDDLALPFLEVLGQLSPEINKTHSKYIKGAEAGMILNSVSGELFNGEEGIDVFLCFIKDSISNGLIEVLVQVLLLLFTKLIAILLVKQPEISRTKIDYQTVTI